MIESLNFLRPTIGGERYTYTHAYMRMNKYTQMGMYLCRCICTHFCKQSSTFMPIYTPTHTNDITVLNLLRVRVNTLTHIHIRVAVCVCVHVCLSVCTMHACSGRFVFNYIYQCLASRLRSPPNPVQSCSSNLLVSRFRNQDFQDLGSWAEFFLLKGNPKCPMDRLNSDMRRGVWFWSSGVHLSLPPLAWKLCLPGS